MHLGLGLVGPAGELTALQSAPIAGFKTVSSRREGKGVEKREEKGKENGRKVKTPRQYAVQATEEPNSQRLKSGQWARSTLRHCEKNLFGIVAL